MSTHPGISCTHDDVAPAPATLSAGGPCEVPCPKAIQYALAIAFILQSFLASMFAATQIGRFIWRKANAAFAMLAGISDSTPEEIERARREARTLVISDIVKLVVTRRYVHGFRYWQDMTMTVVQLVDATIIYNPVPMPIQEMRELALGQHIIVVVPNMYHHMFVDDYVATFPSAVLVGSQGAAERHRPQLPVALPSMVSLPADVELLHVDGVSLDEYIMVIHSARLLCAAHFVSCGTELSVGGATLLPACLKGVVRKVVGWHPDGCLPVYERLAVTDKAAIASFLTGLSALNPVAVISAHGGVCKDDAQKVLTRAWGWVGFMDLGDASSRS